MPLRVHDILAAGATLTDAALERLLPGPETLPHSIHRAMRHSVFAGGKRVRPILVIEACRMVGGGDTLEEGVGDLGAALEMLHTYSLIHDDLPALDNDDLRRGQPTCHKVFGEATAILAGDALQTVAFQTLAALPAPATTVVAVLREVALAIGTGVGRVGENETALPPGMIGGQVMDIEAEGHSPTAALVEAIHRAKTGALITVSLVVGGLYGLPRVSNVGYSFASDAPEPRRRAIRDEAVGAVLAKRDDTVARLRTFGENAGLAFQIVDDILDLTQSSADLGKTAGKDAATTKATWPAVYGVERSLRDAEQLIAAAFVALEPFGHAAGPLKELARYLTARKN